MNFFGHCAVASWTSSAPGHALGAMLPDFASMAGGRIADSPDPDVRAGIDLHHATDAVFHVAPAVTGLMRELDAALDARGCARGPRRAAAHIGVELLLDGALLDDPGYRAAYTAALAIDPPLTWRDPDTAPRYARLRDRLRSHGVPEDLRRPDAITERLARVLGHRPLLAPSPADLRAIHAGLVALQPRVVVATETVLRATRAGLERRAAD